MVRVYMTDGTEDDFAAATEEWSLAKFDVPARDDGKAATVFVTRYGVKVDNNVYLTWSDICNLAGRMGDLDV